MEIKIKTVDNGFLVTVDYTDDMGEETEPIVYVFDVKDGEQIDVGKAAVDLLSTIGELVVPDLMLPKSPIRVLVDLEEDNTCIPAPNMLQ